jgi:hypothetical protein
MNKKEFEKEFQEKQQRQQLEALDANRNRAQSVSIGMSGSCRLQSLSTNLLPA